MAHIRCSLAVALPLVAIMACGCPGPQTQALDPVGYSTQRLEIVGATRRPPPDLAVRVLRARDDGRHAVQFDKDHLVLRLPPALCPKARAGAASGDSSQAAELDLTDEDLRDQLVSHLHSQRHRAGRRADLHTSNLALVPGDRRQFVTADGTSATDWAAVHSVVSGNPLDIACSDPAALFRVWTVQDEPLYVTMGRFGLASDGHLLCAGGLYALAPGRSPVPKNAESVVISPQGLVRARVMRDGQEKTVDLGRLELVRAAGASLQRSVRNGVRVFAAAEGAELTAVDLQRHPLRSGMYLEAEVDPAVEIQSLIDAERTSAAAARALQIAEQAARSACPPAEETAEDAFVTVLADLPWSAQHLEKLGQPMRRERESLRLNVTNEAATVQRLLAVLSGLRLRVKVHRENVANAQTIKPAPYRRRRVVIADSGKLQIEEDPSPLRRVLEPDADTADNTGVVLYPNVFPEIERSEWAAAVREYNVLRQVLMRLDPQYVVPELPAPTHEPPPDGGAKP